MFKFAYAEKLGAAFLVVFVTYLYMFKGYGSFNPMLQLFLSSIHMVGVGVLADLHKTRTGQFVLFVFFVTLVVIYTVL